MPEHSRTPANDMLKSAVAGMFRYSYVVCEMLLASFAATEMLAAIVPDPEDRKLLEPYVMGVTMLVMGIVANSMEGPGLSKLTKKILDNPQHTLQEVRQGLRHRWGSAAIIALGATGEGMLYNRAVFEAAGRWIGGPPLYCLAGFMGAVRYCGIIMLEGSEQLRTLQTKHHQPPGPQTAAATYIDTIHTQHHYQPLLADDPDHAADAQIFHQAAAAFAEFLRQHDPNLDEKLLGISPETAYQHLANMLAEPSAIKLLKDNKYFAELLRKYPFCSGAEDALAVSEWLREEALHQDISPMRWKYKLATLACLLAYFPKALMMAKENNEALAAAPSWLRLPWSCGQASFIFVQALGNARQSVFRTADNFVISPANILGAMPNSFMAALVGLPDVAIAISVLYPLGGWPLVVICLPFVYTSIRCYETKRVRKHTFTCIPQTETPDADDVFFDADDGEGQEMQVYSATPVDADVDQDTFYPTREYVPLAEFMTQSLAVRLSNTLAGGRGGRSPWALRRNTVDTTAQVPLLNQPLLGQTRSQNGFLFK